MRKFLFIVLALLFVTGVARATNIPQMVEPKNYPTVWTELVYNGSASEIVSGYVVDWDFTSSDSSENQYDNMCPWVKLNATTLGVWQAGIVTYGKNIAVGDVGSIIIRGPAYGRVATALTASNLVSGNGSGLLIPFTGGSDDLSTLGVAIKISSLSATGCPDGGAAGAGAWGLVYVNPTAFDEN